MNVYDWDNTIYRGDSTFGFVRYCFYHYPKTLLNLPRILFFGAGYLFKITPKMTFKQNLYHMFVYIPDTEHAVAEFVSSHLDHVKSWYTAQQKEDDVVISASPAFLIEAFGKACGIRTTMASPVDPATGMYNGENCHGEEKVRRFREVFPSEGIDAFYSDSLSDTPLAEMAASAFLVKGDQRRPWPL